jgi:ADP-dependent phosphofructokinase/glucokinase
VEDKELLELEKDGLIEQITTLYSHGELDLPAFETAVTRINDCANRSLVAAEARSLRLALTPMVDDSLSAGSGEEELVCVSGTLRLKGRWVKASRYKRALKSSNARLDLSDYREARGLRLEIDLAAVSSGLRLIVPEGFEVEDHFAERVSSVVKNEPKGPSYGDNRVLIMGALRSSVVKVKYSP